jgi:hypothetical protein
MIRIISIYDFDLHSRVDKYDKILLLNLKWLSKTDLYLLLTLILS